MAKIIKAVDGNTTASHVAYEFTDFEEIFLQEKIYKFINLNNIAHCLLMVRCLS